MAMRRFASTPILLLTTILVGCQESAPAPDPVGGNGTANKVPAAMTPAEPPKYRELFTIPVLTPEEEKQLPGWQGGVGVPESLAFTPDGRALATARLSLGSPRDPNSLEPFTLVKFWDIATEKPRTVWTLRPGTGTGTGTHESSFDGPLAISPDGKRLYVTRTDPSFKRSVTVWDISERKHLADLQGYLGEIRIWQPAIHPNGKWVVVGGAIAFDAATGKKVPEYKFHIRQKAFDTKTQKFVEVVEAQINHFGVSAWALSPDGKLLAYCGFQGVSDFGNELLVISADPAGMPTVKLAEAKDPLGEPSQIAFTADGKRLVGLSHPEYGPLEKDRPDVLRVWQVSDGKVLVNVKVKEAGTLPPIPNTTIGSRARAMAVSPDGHWVALGAADGQVRLYATVSGKEVLTLKAHSKPVRSVAFSRDGKQLASGGEDGVLRVWKAE